MKYSIVLTFVVLLSRAVHGAPVVAEKSVDEVDSWLNEMEQALDKETPAEMQEFTEEQAFMGGPAADRNGQPVNREGPVDLDENVEWWGEEQVNSQEIETDTEIGNVNNAPFRYEPDNDNFQNANPMDYPEESQINEMEEPAFFQQQDENKDAWEESPEQDLWEENNGMQQAADGLEYYERQQGAATDMENEANKMEEPADDFFNQPIANRMEEPEEQPWDESEDGAWDKANDKPWAKPWNEFDDKPWDEDDSKPWARPGDKPWDAPANQPWKEPANTEEDAGWQAERQGQQWENQPWNEPAKTDGTWEEEDGWQAERQGQMWDEPESQSWNEPARTDDETWDEGQQAEQEWDESDSQPWNEPVNTDERWEEEGDSQPWNEPEDRPWNELGKVDDSREEGWQAAKQGQPWEEPARTDETWKNERGWQDNFEGERQDYEMSLNDDMLEENVPEESWDEPNEQDFEDLPFNNEFDNAAVKSNEYADSVDDTLSEQIDEGEFQSFDDIDVAEEMSVNLDNALEESDEFGYDMAKKVPDDFKPKDKPKVTNPTPTDKAIEKPEDVKPEDKNECIQLLYIMAFTSGNRYADSNSLHQVEINVDGKAYKAVLPNLPGDDYQSHKGDLWRMGLNYHFKVDGCVKPQDVKNIAIVEGSKDGWNIDSIVTYFVYSKNYSLPATVDLDVFRWVDGNRKDYHKRFDLTKVY